MSSYTEQVTQYIEGRRSTSIANILEFFPTEKKTLYTLVKELEESKKIRVMNSPCSLDCSSCSTCGDTEEAYAERLRDTTILVSLKL